MDVTSYGTIPQDADRSTHAEIWTDGVRRSSTTSESKLHSERLDGGIGAWMVLFGSFCAFFSGLSMMNSIGVYQSWIATHQLAGVSPQAIGWIFSFYTFFSFFAGLFLGPIFDAKGPRAISFVGGTLLILMYLGLGLCRNYWEFFFCIGVVGGLSTSCLFTCAISCVQHWFSKKRGLATGIALSGGSISGMIFPSLFGKLLPAVGFARGTMVATLILLPFVVCAVCFMRARVAVEEEEEDEGEKEPQSWLPQLGILRSPMVALTTVGLVLNELAMYLPVTYLASYALHWHQTPTVASRILTYLSLGSLFGRWSPALLSLYLGPAAMQTLGLTLCSAATFCIWFPAGANMVNIVVYAFIFGIGSGCVITTSSLCVAKLCKTTEYGRYVTTIYTVSSLGSLTGIPIGGRLLEADHSSYRGLILFAGAIHAFSALCFLAVLLMDRSKWTKR